MKRWHWIAAGCAVVAALVLAFTMHKAGLACANPGKRTAMKIVEANGCVEFWFNRYQSLIGGILALIGAALTVWIVRVQIAVGRERDARIARMALLHTLQEFCRDCEVELSLYTSKRKDRIPELALDRIPEHLAHLPASEAQRVYSFAGRIFNLNQYLASSSKESRPEDFLTVKLAQCWLKSLALMEGLSKALGWEPVRIPEHLKDFYDRMAAKGQEIDKKHNEPPL